MDQANSNANVNGDQENNIDTNPSEARKEPIVLQGRSRCHSSKTSKATSATSIAVPYHDFASSSGDEGPHYMSLPEGAEATLLAAAEAAGAAVRWGSKRLRTHPPSSSPSPPPSDASSTIKPSKVLPFPLVLFGVLEYAEEQNYDHIISWKYHGRAFCVHKHERFVSDIMPCFFRQTRFPSFLRQMALYGFTRLVENDEPNEYCYYHEMFLRGMPTLCQQMKRTKRKGGHNRTRRKDPNFLAMTIVGVKTPGIERSLSQASLFDSGGQLSEESTSTEGNVSIASVRLSPRLENRNIGLNSGSRNLEESSDTSVFPFRQRSFDRIAYRGDQQVSNSEGSKIQDPEINHPDLARSVSAPSLYLYETTRKQSVQEQMLAETMRQQLMDYQHPPLDEIWTQRQATVGLSSTQVPVVQTSSWAANLQTIPTATSSLLGTIEPMPRITAIGQQSRPSGAADTNPDDPEELWSMIRFLSDVDLE